MSQIKTPHHLQAHRLLVEYLAYVHQSSRPITPNGPTAEDIRVAQEQLQVHQRYLLDLIAIGLKSGTVPF